MSVFTGILDDLGILGFLAGVFGVGDDLIGIQTLQINAKDIILKRPMQKFGNIEFNFESALLSDGNASYKLYYEMSVEKIDPPKEQSTLPLSRRFPRSSRRPWKTLAGWDGKKLTTSPQPEPKRRIA